MNRSDRNQAGVYDPSVIEPKWQRYWAEHGTFKTPNPGDAGFDASKSKCYVLDMFPYPSGAGLHVGHPVGYCATDIYSRYKRMQGFNVLHPMGYDAFGLPAEQYAIETGVHPAVTTEANISNMRRQLKMFGFSYDWDREIATCHADFYQFTQWIFVRLFNSWFDPRAEASRPIEELVSALETGALVVTASYGVTTDNRQADILAWNSLSAAEKRRTLDGQRLAYLDEIPVNWCPALGTVLANEEVTNDDRSDRGNHPVFRRPMRQWMLRITRYADRLLKDIESVDWPAPIKLMQRNWIGRSTGAEVDFPICSGREESLCNKDFQSWKLERGGRFPEPPEASVIRIFTTRPDTLFGATYMVLAPEHPLVERITTHEHLQAVRDYVETARHKSELSRTAETKEKTGVFTGAYATNPVNGESIPIWVADYVLMGYGTGAIMAVPGGDTRDFEFAKAFDLPIVAVVEPTLEWAESVAAMPKGTLQGLRSKAADAIAASVERWKGEPDPGGRGEQIEFAERFLREQGNWVGLSAADIQQVYMAAPSLFEFPFAGEGVAVQSPADATWEDVCDLNGLSTADAKRTIVEWLETRGLGRGAVNYKLRDWIFSRQKYWGEPFPVLHGDDGSTMTIDASELPLQLPELKDFKPEVMPDDSTALPKPPLGRVDDWMTVTRDGTTYRRDANTMPQWAGSCWYYLRYISPRNDEQLVDADAEAYWMPVDLYVGGAEHAVLHLLYARFWHKVLFDLGYVSTPEPFMKLVNQGMIQAFAYRDSAGRTLGEDGVEAVDGEEDGGWISRESGERVERVVAKMSKSLRNVVTPDDIIEEYGADTFRLYEMFMGPIESSKPWNTRDVPGLQKLLQRIWRMFVDCETGELSPTLVDTEPDDEVNRQIHKTTMRVTEDIEQLKLNTAIAQLFEFVNVMTPRSERPRSVMERFVLLLSPFAPHMAEELWERLGHAETLAYECWPAHDPELARDASIEIAVQVFGKIKSRIVVSSDADEAALEAAAMADERVQQAIAGKTIRKVIVVKGRLVNIVAS